MKKSKHVFLQCSALVILASVAACNGSGGGTTTNNSSNDLQRNTAVKSSTITSSLFNQAKYIILNHSSTASYSMNSSATDRDIVACNVSTSGTISSCVKNKIISGDYSDYTFEQFVLNSSDNVMFIPYFKHSTSTPGIVSCQVNGLTLSECNEQSFVGSTAITNPHSIVLTPDDSVAFIANTSMGTGNTNIASCSVSDALLSDCHASGGGGQEDAHLAISPDGKIVYLAEIKQSGSTTPYNHITTCSVDAANKLLDCTHGQTFDLENQEAHFLSVAPTTGNLFFPNANNNDVIQCKTDPDSHSVISCGDNNATNNLLDPSGVAISKDSNYALITDDAATGENSVTRCTILADGGFDTCTSAMN